MWLMRIVRLMCFGLMLLGGVGDKEESYAKKKVVMMRICDVYAFTTLDQCDEKGHHVMCV